MAIRSGLIVTKTFVTISPDVGHKMFVTISPDLLDQDLLLQTVYGY